MGRGAAKPDPRQKIPALGQRLIPCNLFAWLDDPVGYVAPLDAPKLSSKDDSTAPSDLQALIKLRNALQLHEALGQSLAAGSVLLKMGRRLPGPFVGSIFPARRASRQGAGDVPEKHWTPRRRSSERTLMMRRTTCLSQLCMKRPTRSWRPRMNW